MFVLVIAVLMLIVPATSWVIDAANGNDTAAISHDAGVVGRGRGVTAYEPPVSSTLDSLATHKMEHHEPEHDDENGAANEHDEQYCAVAHGLPRSLG